MSAETRHPKITVLGSINMDLVVRCHALPRPGETLTASDFSETPGGKGANQAVAASRAGGTVWMIGRVGADSFATRLTQNLMDEQVDCIAVRDTPESPSGIAIVAVDAQGRNQIIVVPGANSQLSPADVDLHADRIRDSDVLLLQLEVPLDTVLHARRLARAAGTRVVLDPAPAPSDSPSELFDVDLICPNETETAALTGIRPDTDASVRAAIHELHRLGARAVALTLGDQGVAVSDGTACVRLPAHAVSAVDTTAAGDAFAGAVAVAWAESNSLTDAVRTGNAAGALAASRSGSQRAMPRRQETDELTAKLPVAGITI